MHATRLTEKRVEKPWGRTILWPGFADPAAGREPIGEIWFDEPGRPELLVKYLFTSERLSVQVHPDDAAARAAGHPCGKAECWLILAAKPGATIALGPRHALDGERLRAAAEDGSIVELLDWRPVSPGDVLYTPPGTIHAIGAGITLIEVQQNIDLTYRLYDYGRPRPLHLDESLAVADLEPWRGGVGRFGSGCLVEAPAFTVTGLEAGTRDVSPGLFILFAGEGRIGDQPVAAGQCWRLGLSAQIELAPGARALHAIAR